jgi:hypothetical protein
VTLAPKGLLIEEQRVNLLLRSEEFENAAWTISNSSVTANTSTAPNGTTSADTLSENLSNGFHAINQTVTAITGVITLSLFAKLSSGTRFLTISLSNSLSNYGSATFDLSSGTNTQTQAAGTFSGASATIALVAGSFYRCTLTLTATSMDVVRIGLNDTGTPTGNNRGLGEAYTGDGTSGLFIWGAQLELGSFATSYIPTVASQVTRAADSASMIGNNFARWFNQTAGSTLVDFNTFATSSLNVVEFNAGQSVNPISLYRETTTWRYRTSLANLNLNGAQFVTNNKTAFVYAASDYVISVNGNPVQTNTGVGSIAPHTQLIIGGAASSFSYGANSSLNGTIKRIAYYPRRLANTELQGITS